MVGYDLAEAGTTGSTVSVTLHWEATGEPPRTTSPLSTCGHRATPLLLPSTTANHARAGIRRPHGKKVIAFLTNIRYTFPRRCPRVPDLWAGSTGRVTAYD